MFSTIKFDKILCDLKPYNLFEIISGKKKLGKKLVSISCKNINIKHILGS